MFLAYIGYSESSSTAIFEHEDEAFKFLCDQLKDDAFDFYHTCNDSPSGLDEDFDHHYALGSYQAAFMILQGITTTAHDYSGVVPITYGQHISFSNNR